MIKNIQELLRKLENEIEQRNLFVKYSKKRYFAFLKTATYSDDGWQRIYNIWWRLLLLTILTTSMGIGLNIILNINQELALIVTLLHFVFPTIVYIITEILFGKIIWKFSKVEGFIIPERDIKYEGLVYKRALLWSVAFYISSIIVWFGIQKLWF